MKIGIMQPYFFPYLGYFQLIKAVDVYVNLEAGDVVIWDSRLWHGTRENSTESKRWAIVATCCRWWLKQHWNIPQNLPQEIYAQLSDSQKAVLGFCSISPNDESDGIDLKRDYDSLLPDVRGYRPNNV